jgi:hypothetical protein
MTSFFERRLRANSTQAAFLCESAPTYVFFLYMIIYSFVLQLIHVNWMELNRIKSIAS